MAAEKPTAERAAARAIWEARMIMVGSRKRRLDEGGPRDQEMGDREMDGR